MKTWAAFARLRPRVRLWMKLALFAALGVVTTHALHLVIANRVAGAAVIEEQQVLGRAVARVVAHEITDALLVNDVIALHEIASGTASGKDIAYCFIVRDGEVLASSFAGETPRALVDLRKDGEPGPLVVVSHDTRTLDLVEPVVEASDVVVRLGMDMSTAGATRRTLSILLGSLAIGVIILGVAAAFLMGRAIARPLGELVRAADRFDPREHLIPVPHPRGSDEIAEVAERFNVMMQRLQVAHDEQVHAREVAAATERMAALGALVGGVAHEVNNPLAGLKNCLRRLQRDDLPPDRKQEYLELMEEGLERIEDVVQRLLDLGRPRPLHLVAVPLATLARHGTSLLRPLLRKRGIVYVEELEGELGRVKALSDDKQVAQAMLNLLLNAAYVTPAGKQIRLLLREKKGLVGLGIADEGPGIPEAIRARIVDPFFTTKPEGDGTGLGLSVTRSIADAHGGDLTFEFPERGGTIATLWLQRAKEGEEREVSKESREPLAPPAA
jgi:two-component system NtrC family sensor kinase